MQSLELFVGEQPKIFKISRLLDVKFNLADPQHGMIVSQTALPFFEIGFKQICRIPKLGVSSFIFFNQPVDNGAGSLANELLPQLIHEFRIYKGPTADEPCIQNWGEDFEIFRCKRQALL